MKKNYITPSLMTVPVQMTQMICMVSLKSDTGFSYGGEITSSDDFVARGKDNDFWDWTEWDESLDEWGEWK